MSAVIELTDELASFLEDLRDSGISGEIGWSCDGEWRAKIGDRRSGYVAEGSLSSLGAAAEWLRSRAIELYQNSEFAKTYRRGSR